MRIAVCVATYQRPVGLAELLESLVLQKGVEGDFELFVVDNDPEGSARIVVEQFQGRGPRIHYEIEPTPGIPAARNRTIAAARNAAALMVAFIDDDEFATPYWLATMSSQLMLSNADAVSGPVEPLFPARSPEWAARSRLYHRATFSDGARLSYASTANSLVRVEAIAGVLEPFRSDFQFTGGSDTFLFHSLAAAGKRIVWEPNGLVYERVPGSRLSMRWLVRRSYRHGVTLARCDRLIYGRSIKVLKRAVLGAVHPTVGAIEVSLGLVQGNDRWRSGLVRIARGVGTLAGLLGWTYDEYRR
jgi:succinoglycan biosynthesis protein ExoM